MKFKAPLLWPMLSRSYRLRSLELVMLALLQSGTVISLALLCKHLLQGQLTDQHTAFGIAMGLVLTAALIRYRERHASEQLAVRYVHQLRLRMFDRLTGPRPVNAGSTAVHTVRFASDLTALRQWVAFAMGRLVSGIALVAAVLIGLSLIAPAIAIVISAGLTVFAVCGHLLGRQLKSAITQQRKARGRVTHRIGQILQHLEPLRRTDRTVAERTKLAAASDSLSTAQAQRGFWSGALRGASELTSRSGLLCVIGFALFQPQLVQAPSDFVVAMLLTSLLAVPLRELIRVYELWTSATVAAAKLAPLLTPAATEAQLHLPNARTVTLTLHSGKLPSGQALQPLQISAGTKVAVTSGTTGCVTTELLHLLAGSDTRHNLVELDAIPVSHIAAEDLARTVGSAFRSDPILPGSISKNIRFRQRKASQRAITRACRQTGLIQDLQLLPEGLATRAADLGAIRNADFEARLLWTRAILKQPAIVILDQLDQAFSAAGLQLFTKFVNTYPGTVVFSTHNPDLIKLADLVWRIPADHDRPLHQEVA